MRKYLTPLSTSFIGWFASLFLIGLLFGNMVFIYMGLIPLFLLLFGLLIDQPREVEIERGDLNKSVWTDDELEVNIKVRIMDGIGIVTLIDELPSTFELVDGNNFRMLWKGLGEKELMLSYKVKCVKRGSYTLSNVKWGSRHVLGLKKEISGTCDTEVGLTVRPRTMELRKIRGKKDIASSLFPRADMSKIGVSTTDFKEIRNYQYGDPLSKINWKATARRVGRGGFATPLVNEYEYEGKKTIWIFLDAASSLEIGTSIDNVFEYALKSADAVTRYFTDRGYRVGMYLYNDGEKLFYPDTGKKQYLKLSKELVDLKSYDRNEGLDNAVRKCRAHILRYNPLSIVITEIRSESSESLIEGIKKLSAMSGGRRRKRVPIMVVNVLSHYLNPTPPSEYKEYAISLQKIKHSPITSKLRRMGATVVEWDPQKDKFTTVLIRQGERR
ncbi:MAG: DUF58 domain-containing protein [Candidatus Syntrophoarchaeum sp.]|nr:DUF58 domain-containing protein [Methanomicrobia archaeon]MBL7117276.1 DUF58 domain-containing protein [Candidatus Syntrophoarchaeum sp.]